MALVCDTGPLLALLDADDKHHQECVEAVERLGGDLVVPAPVLVELDYWVRKMLGQDAWSTFVEDIDRGGYRIADLSVDDILRSAELESKYADLRLGFVDAAVIATCERLGETLVATLDRRHFGAVRPRHCDVLTIVP